MVLCNDDDPWVLCLALPATDVRSCLSKDEASVGARIGKETPAAMRKYGVHRQDVVELGLSNLPRLSL